ncbi:MAG: SDR family oxidoreductase [Planctomycetes bacterium]|nr:SDR family oxidoreductase [Planctomycetota bacterium]
MRIVVTGGAGFVGSHLCDYLLEEGHSVVCLDNLLTGTMENITHLRGNDKFTYVEQNVTEHISVEGRVDAVLHMASPASPVDYLKHPIPTLKVGSIGTLNALGLAKDKKSKFLLTSTSEVYGDPKVHPQTEDYWGNVNPVGPRGVYDEAKRFAEALTMAYHRAHNVDTHIARIFNTYGPRMRLNDGRVLPAFISQALRDEDLTVFGDGSQTRSFCYVSDLVEGLYKLLMSDEHDPVNIGNPSEITVLQLAREIIELTSTRGKVVFRPLPQDDPKVRRPDISKAQRVLGWEPRVDRQEGLKETVEYFVQKIRGQTV